MEWRRSMFPTKALSSTWGVQGRVAWGICAFWGTQPKDKNQLYQGGNGPAGYVGLES